MIVAGNGAEAWIIVRDIAPSVILLDMRMPVMDGFEFMQKARERNLMVPIVAMTATALIPELQSRVGASDHLSKPCDIIELVSKVAKYQGQDHGHG